MSKEIKIIAEYMIRQEEDIKRLQKQIKEVTKVLESVSSDMDYLFRSVENKHS